MTQNSHQSHSFSPRPAFSLLAMLAIWLQVIFSGLHVAAEAHAATGGNATTSPFWMICSANGLLELDVDGNPVSSQFAQSDCAICASGAVDLWTIGDLKPQNVELIRFQRVPPAYFAQTGYIDSLSPRAGATRAPPFAPKALFTTIPL